MKLHLCRSLTAIAASVLLSISVHAGSSSGVVTITYALNAGDYSVFIFKNTATISGGPACATIQEYAVRLNTPAGRAIQQQVQLAVALGKPVFVSGEGTCSAWGDRETVNYVAIYW